MVRDKLKGFPCAYTQDKHYFTMLGTSQLSSTSDNGVYTLYLDSNTMMGVLLRCLFLGGLISEGEKGKRRPIKKTKMDVSAILHKSRPSTDLVKKRSNGQCTYATQGG